MATAIFSSAAEAAEGDDDTCISISHIRRTAVVDDRSVLFYMNGSRVLKATLAFDCPSLAFHKSFSYRAYTSRLCPRVDSIISRSGSHCPIADITPISRTDARRLMQGPEED